MALTGDYSSLW